MQRNTHSQKQQEWKIKKEFDLLFPTCEKGVNLLCQSTIFVKGIRYRDIILSLSKTNKNNYRLTKTFLNEVTRNQVNVNDKNWITRFSDIYSDIGIEDKGLEERLAAVKKRGEEKKKSAKKSEKEQIAHLIQRVTGKKPDQEQEDIEEEDDGDAFALKAEDLESSSSSVKEEGSDEEDVVEDVVADDDGDFVL